jgi:hypothetical protein
MIVIVDDGAKEPVKVKLSDGSLAYEVLNTVRVILGDGRERHIVVTNEGIVIDLVEAGEVVDTRCNTHEELLESPEEWEV